MRIAFVLDTFSLGGIETVALNYIKLLVERNYEIDVYILNPKQIGMLKKLPQNVNSHVVPFSKYLCPELYSYGVKKWAWGKFAYPIIHSILFVLIKLRRLISKPLEFDVAIAFSGHLSDITFVTEQFVKAKQKISWCHGSLLSYLAICDGYPKLYKKIDKFVTLSDLDQCIYAGHRFFYNKKIFKIYNPVIIRQYKVDEERVRQLNSKYGDYILMIARATYPKDHLTAIKAIELLHQRGCDINIVFLGDGEKLGEYKEYAKNAQIDYLCHFEGNRDDVQDYIFASYVNLLASRFEGLPTVIVEAMAFGKPCIMTKSDGGEVSCNGKYCFLEEIEDYQAIAADIQRLYADPDTYTKYSKLSYERFKAFDPEIVLDRFEKMINS